MMKSNWWFSNYDPIIILPLILVAFSLNHNLKGKLFSINYVLSSSNLKSPSITTLLYCQENGIVLLLMTKFDLNSYVKFNMVIFNIVNISSTLL